jgi:hypothetical protein
MRRIVRLTESDLTRLVKRIINESNDETYTTYLYDKDRHDTEFANQIVLKYLETIEEQNTLKIKFDVVAESLLDKSNEPWSGFSFFDCKTGLVVLTGKTNKRIGSIDMRFNEKVEAIIKSKYCQVT